MIFLWLIDEIKAGRTMLWEDASRLADQVEGRGDVEATIGDVRESQWVCERRRLSNEWKKRRLVVRKDGGGDKR